FRHLDRDAVGFDGPGVDARQRFDLCGRPLLGLCVVQPALGFNRDCCVVALEVGIGLVGGVHHLLDGAVLPDVGVGVCDALLVEVAEQGGCLGYGDVSV